MKGADIDTNSLNPHYQSLPVSERISTLFQHFPQLRILLTSSFGTNSAMLLHLYSRAVARPTVHFIDTGYHFPSTLSYKEELTARYGLHVIDVKPDEWQHAYTVRNRTWQTDPDFCCSVNKVTPLAPILAEHDIWISGVMSWQTPHRANMEIFEVDGDIIKFSPLLDVTEEQRDAYVVQHELPPHPLLAHGYASVGCTHCTAPGTGRAGRWPTKIKMECGLHR